MKSIESTKIKPKNTPNHLALWKRMCIFAP